MNHLGLQRAALLGHSLGGRIAMLTALRYPNRISSLVVADMAPVNYTTNSTSMSEVRRVVYAAAMLPLSKPRSRKEAEDLLRESIPDAATRQFVLQNLVIDLSNTEQPSLSWRVNFPAILKSLAMQFDWDLNEPCQVPSLFVAGGKSDYVRPEHYSAISSLFVDSSVHNIPEAGHWVHAEKLDQFANVTGRFLTRIDLRNRSYEQQI